MENNESKHDDKPPGSPIMTQGSDLGFPGESEFNIPIPPALMPLSSFPFGVRQVMPQLHPHPGERPWVRTPHHQFHGIGNQAAPDNVRNHGSYVHGLQNPYLSSQFNPVRVNPGSSLPRSMMVGNVNNSNVRMPQPNRRFASPEGRTPALCLTSDGEEMRINNNLTTGAVRPYCPQNLDGNFLTLGVGKTTETMSKCNISERNISSNNNLREIFPQPNNSHGQSSRISLDPHFNMASSFPGLQNSEDCWKFTSDDRTIISHLNSGCLSNPHYIAETHEGDRKQHLFVPNNFATGNTGNRDGGIDLNYDHPGHSARQSRESGFSLSSNLRGNFTQQATGQSERCYMETLGNSLSESSRIFPLNTGIVTGNTSLQDQSGGFCEPQISSPLQSSRTLTEAVATDQEISVTNVNRISQTSRVSTQPSLKRGATLSSQATFRSQRRKTTKSSVGPSIPTQIESASPPPDLSAYGLHPVRANALFSSANNNRSFLPLHQTAPLSSLPPQTASSFQPQPRPSMLPLPSWPSSLQPQPGPSMLQPPSWPSSLQPQPGPSMLPQPSWPSSLPPRRTAPPFPIRPRTAPAPPFPVQPHRAQPHPPQPQQASPRLSHLLTAPLQQRPPTSSPLSTIRQGSDQTLKTLGYKCHLCNRDLSFTPEGPVYQPSPPPIAAVLPCGHTFHDHCLQLITIPDQAKDPPCIPCATAEK